MAVQVRAQQARRSDTVRTWGAAIALAVAATACGNLDTGETRAVDVAPRAAPGQPAGTIVLATGGTDVAALAQRVRGAITDNGGSVVAVVDHTADAQAAGVSIPASTLVIGGSPAGQLPLLRIDQRAGVDVPQRYHLRQAPDGATSLTVNSADYVAAISGVTDGSPRDALRDATEPVLAAAVPGAALPLGSPLVGVTPWEYLVTVYGSADVPATVERLRRNAGRVSARSVAVADLSAGSADSGPAIRATSTVYVSHPAETPLLVAAPSIGLDLPLSFVIWLDDTELTQIGYPDVRRIATRHGVPANDPNIERLAADADRLAQFAAGLIE
jgi:uncharacterized protein (DUF302 family)